MMHYHSTSTRTLVALIFFCIGHNLPSICAQSAKNCVALPCTYKNECRDKFNACGGGQLYCNSESLWLPACGGGGNFERPSENDNADSNAQVESTTPSPTPRPTLRSTSTPTKRPTNAPTLSPQQPSTETQPTPASIVSRADAPTSTSTEAAFEGWLSEQNNPKNEIDASTDQEDTESYNPSNTDWFDKEGWDGRREKGENNDTNEALAMRRTSCALLGVATIVQLFMMLG